MASELLTGLSVPDSIAEDECIYCFETPFNNITTESDSPSTDHSLNICLSCFQPVCDLHCQLHMDVTKNSCESIHIGYLNIAKIEKPKKEDKEGSANKKIKLQVIEKSESEIYKTVWKLIKCNEVSTAILLDSDTVSQENIPIEISKILNAKSQVLADQAKSWELEIKTCEHSSNFDPSTVPEITIDTSKCKDCDLDSNLWLCLHCGNIGCGREQVGIEGHSHGLKHYDTNKDHHLAIKLGSLSKTSNDIYCYQCNDEVKFSDGGETLSQILQKFGINMDNKAATEKTLTELQVEQNLNWDFKMTDSQGNELIKLNPNDELGCGLLNLGNSCYLNSIIQCLFNGGVNSWSEELTEDIGTEFPLDVVYPSNNLKCQLIKLNNAINVNPDFYPNGIKPRSFKKCIGGSHEEFSSNRQQDSMEFLTYLIDQLDSKYFKTHSTKNPNDLFKFSMEDRLQCNNCNKVKYSYDANEAIQLPLEQNDEPQDILERLDDYFKGEIIEFKCPSCNQMSEASRKPSFKSFPDTLVLNPIRIKFVNWTPVKTSNELNLPGVDNADNLLDVSKYKYHGFDKSTEELIEDSEKGSDEFEPNGAVLVQLKEMGFTENAIFRALYETGNHDNTEVAMNWLFQHMDDTDLNSEFQMKPVDNECDEESLSNMISMGLDMKLCKKALKLNQGDVNKSVEWVFNNMDDDGDMEIDETSSEVAEYGNIDCAPYKLRGVVCHKGNSVHSGHYVAFIRKEIDGMNRWILYNDEKIVLAEDTEEIKKNGYIFFYSKFT